MRLPAWTVLLLLAPTLLPPAAAEAPAPIDAGTHYLRADVPAGGYVAHLMRVPASAQREDVVEGRTILEYVRGWSHGAGGGLSTIQIFTVEDGLVTHVDGQTWRSDLAGLGSGSFAVPGQPRALDVLVVIGTTGSAPFEMVVAFTGTWTGPVTPAPLAQGTGLQITSTRAEGPGALEAREGAAEAAHALEGPGFSLAHVRAVGAGTSAGTLDVALLVDDTRWSASGAYDSQQALHTSSGGGKSMTYAGPAASRVVASVQYDVLLGEAPEVQIEVVTLAWDVTPFGWTWTGGLLGFNAPLSGPFCEEPAETAPVQRRCPAA